MKLLLILFTFCSFVFANSPERRTIESISYRSRSGATVALIELSDGSVWKWLPDDYSENLLRRWKEGDEIIIQALNHPGFALKNLAKNHYTPTVALTYNSYPLFPTVRMSDSCNGVIDLSDGTRWQILYDFNKRTLHHWEPGDRIITVLGLQNNFELINLDIPYENRGKIERVMEVIAYDPNAILPECVDEEENP